MQWAALVILSSESGMDRPDLWRKVVIIDKQTHTWAMPDEMLIMYGCVVAHCPGTSALAKHCLTHHAQRPNPTRNHAGIGRCSLDIATSRKIIVECLSYRSCYK